jgi:hypothetical protein
MTRNMPKKIRVRIFVEERNDGMVGCRIRR